MSSLVIQLAEEELKKDSNWASSSLTIDFEDESYKKGPTFALGMQEQALKYCNRHSTRHLKSLIVKNKYSLTIWIQQKISAAKSQKISTPEPQPQATVESSSTIQKIPTKTVVRHYRGQTYEVEVPDYSTIQNMALNQQKPRRKYRGQYVD